MVLSREQIHLVVNGGRALLLLPHDGDGRRPPHAVGSTIAVQTRSSRPALCRVAVTRATDIGLGELGDDEARQLGHDDLDALMEAWVEAHGLWNENGRAWLLHIQLDPRALPHLLVPAAGRHGVRALADHGYTTEPFEAMPDEPEAVDDFTIAAKQRAAETAAAARFQQLLAERRRLPPDERLRRILADAAECRIRPDRNLHVIEQRIEALERQVHRPATLATASP